MIINKKGKASTLFKVILALLLAVLFAAALFAAVKTLNRDAPKAKNGVLKLDGWNLKDDGTLMLNGEWAFYWKEFVSDTENTKPDIFANVPDVWNGYEVNGEELSGFGYATYSLCVKGVGDEQLALRIPPCSTAYKLYIDGKLLAQNGVIGTSTEAAKPEYELESMVFSPEDDEFSITVQISNFTYARGGFWYPMILGTASQISGMDRIVSYRDLFLIGSFITISLFCFSMYFLAKRKISIVLFALLALVTALRTSIYGDYLFASIGLPFRFLIIVEYITLIWMPVLIALFLLSLSKKMNFKEFAFVISFIALAMTLFVVIAPVHVFTQYTVLIEILEIGTALYAVFCLLKSKNQSKAAIAVGSGVLILCGIYDVLYQNCILGGFMELSPIGFFIMLNIWGVVLAKDYTDLTEYARASVDKAQAAELAFFQAQIKPHFLYNALNVIATLCRLDSEYAEKLTIELSKYLHYTFEFKNLSNYISFSSELDFIETYVKIEKARFVNEFNVVYDLCDTSGLMVPPLSIQPLIENAIRHGVRKKEEFGTVTLKVKEEKGYYVIEVSDDGAGIEPSKLERLKRGEREDNEGVGLFNVKHRIESLYKTDFRIESEVGKGTRIFITIPKIL